VPSLPCTAFFRVELFLALRAVVIGPDPDAPSMLLRSSLDAPWGLPVRVGVHPGRFRMLPVRIVAVSLELQSASRSFASWPLHPRKRGQGAHPEAGPLSGVPAGTGVQVGPERCAGPSRTEGLAPERRFVPGRSRGRPRSAGICKGRDSARAGAAPCPRASWIQSSTGKPSFPVRTQACGQRKANDASGCERRERTPTKKTSGRNNVFTQP
jgi:hypothetical protein